MKNRWPMKKGERLMYAVLGRSGGIHAFAESAWKAENIRDRLFNIGKNKPKRYLVTFKEIERDK